MINILHIINGWPPGGILEQSYLICKYLPKNKFKQYSIGYCHFDGFFVKKFEDVGVLCLKSDENYSNLKEIIETYKIDIVHKQTGGGDFPEYCKLLKEMNVPLIESLHCPRKSAIPVDLIERILYTTPYTLEKNDTEHQEKMVSIQYALDLKEPIADGGKINEDGKIIVGRLGRIIEEKRQDILLMLAQMAYKDFGDMIEFHLAGTIPTDFKCHIDYGKAFLEEVKKTPNCKYFGFIENKYDFWKTLDICINPVCESSFEIVFLEAMACGIPILTWDNSAAKHVVQNAGIVTKEDISDIYEGFKRLYFNPKLRKMLGDIGVEYIKNRYSLNNFIDQHSSLYEEIYDS